MQNLFHLADRAGTPVLEECLSRGIAFVPFCPLGWPRGQVVLGEAALRTLVCTPETLAGQLSKLLSVIRLPALELGIIGFSQPMPVFPFTAFSVRDDDLIVIERLTGEQYRRAEERPEEVASFLKFFDLLREAASTGTEAEASIERALESLR